MKHNMKWATLVVVGAAMMFACNSENTNTGLEGFEKTASGLYYKFEKQNPDAKLVQMGDVMMGEITLKFDTITLVNNVGKPDFFGQAVPNWDPVAYEGLLMMHEGDVATFVYDADSLAKKLNGNAPHPSYQPATGQKVTYTINLQRLVPLEEYNKQQTEKFEQMKVEEPERISNYIKENNITVKPTADGLYIILKEKGNGEKVTNGKEVTVHYTGRLLDGTVFDSSVERNTPFTFTIGEGKVIAGWDKGLLGQTVGTKLQLVIPSKMGYGERGAGGQILPYSPLVFDVEIIGVK